MKKTDMITDLGIALHHKFEPLDPDWTLDLWWSNLLSEVRKLRDRIKELEAANSSLYQNYKQLKGQYRNVQNIIGIREERIEDLETMVGHRDATIREQNKMLESGAMWTSSRPIPRDAELEAEHGRRSTLIAHQDQRIAELEMQNADCQEVVDRQEVSLAFRQNLVNDREGQIAKLQKALDLAANNEQVRMKQLAGRELVIMELQQANSKLQQDLEYNEKLLAQHEAAAGDRPTSLEKEMANALNFWGADGDLDTADFILATFLLRQLYALKEMKAAEKKHGIPSTHVTGE